MWLTNCKSTKTEERIDLWKFAFAILIVGLFFGCQKNTEDLQYQDSKLFKLVGPENSGISFRNDLTYNRKENFLIYEYYYNGGGVAIGDINNDGLLDIYLTGNQVDDHLYLNKGNLKFEEISKNAGILKNGGWSTGVSFVDVNGDGFQDIYVCKALYDESPELRANELYINNGDLTFTESAKEFGIANFWRTMDATFFDFDKDEDMDLFLVNGPPTPGMLSALHGINWLDTLFSCRLYENMGGHFKDITQNAGVSFKGYGLSASTADFNNDGWTDIYVTNDYDSPDMLYINQGNGKFENQINKSMKHITNFSMGCDVADINEDGWIDLVVTDMLPEDNYRQKANMGGMPFEKFWNIANAGGNYQYMFNTLQLNRGTDSDGNLHFSEIAQFAGVAATDWSWSPLFADFDNDGLKDLFISNGIKRDLRNFDGVGEADKYFKSVLAEYSKNNPGDKNIELRDLVDFDLLANMLPSQPLTNYLFQNLGEFNFENKAIQWGLDQKTFSSGAAYGDLDNDGDLDLVINNVDDFAYLYENTSNHTNQNNYLRVRLTQNDTARSFFGAKVKIEVQGKSKYYEFSNARGFYSSSESIAHFGLGKDTLVTKVSVYWLNGETTTINNVVSNQEIVFDRSEAMKVNSLQRKENPIFKEITKNVKVNYIHVENNFADFKREPMLPHKMSQFGPAIAVGDVNNDGLDDFYIGAAFGRAGQIYLQQKSGTFKQSYSMPWIVDVKSEDTGALLFDCDGDNDLDLYVVSGGNELPAGSPEYIDRLYINDGSGNFSKSLTSLPDLPISGSRVIPADFDKDGDLDLFVGGRQIPGKYPEPASSYILLNESNSSGNPLFRDVTTEIAAGLNNLGMVTDAVWSDFDNDQDLDLLITGEWMPVTVFENTNGKFVNVSEKLGLQNEVGWWFSIDKADFDDDGDDDYVIGNLGENYKYKASYKEPFSIHYMDYDNNGKNDIILGYYNFGKQFPLSGRSRSINQIAALKDKFPTYHDFAKSTLIEIYEKEFLKKALNYNAKTFSSMYMENLGEGNFELNKLPALAQFSPINDFIIEDMNNDGFKDILLAGNLYGSEIETMRADAGLGLLLLGDGKGHFIPMDPHISGLYLNYNVKQLAPIYIGNSPAFIAASNNDFLRLYSINTPMIKDIQ